MLLCSILLPDGVFIRLSVASGEGLQVAMKVVFTVQLDVITCGTYLLRYIRYEIPTEISTAYKRTRFARSVFVLSRSFNISD